MIEVKSPRFDLGVVVATPNALTALQAAGQSVWYYLSRHAQADWGGVDALDKTANDEAIEDGGRLLSSYVLSTSQTLWIITEARGDDGRRASTCLLLDTDY